MAAVRRVFILGYGQISNTGRPYCFHQVKEMKWREKGNEYNEIIFAMLQRTQLCRSTLILRTFAPKSSYGEIFFISPLELVDKVLTPKMEKKNGGHRLCFGENGSGKMP